MQPQQACEQSKKDVEQPTPSPLTIVGIGASAGGLSALKKFFAKMPQNTGLAFVVVVHLSPDHKSHLAELLQPHCPMPVCQVSSTIPLEPDHVYVIPPGANLNTIDTHLRPSELEEHRRERAPIDHFFRTLAQTHDGHSVGVVLTGTGSDGTLGLRRIRERGGLTIVQAPEDAEYDGMPRSAIASGDADLVLPLDQIPQHVVEIARTHPRVPFAEEPEPAEVADERTLQQILAQVRTRTGHDFGEYKRSTLMRRIRRRMQLQRVTELGAYLQVLRTSRDEVLRLFEDLLITVTEFFRDTEVFQMLEEKIIPGLMTNQPVGTPVRVWSVGCSTGEEAYSLAILLLEAAEKCEVRPQIQIFASDLHDHSLQRAREGIYPDSIAGDVTPQRLDRFFTKENGSYRVRKDVREMVVFAPHSLIKDPPFSRLDLIVCRNVLIYLQRNVQRDIMGLFHYALRPDGLLLLGSAEAVDNNDLFLSEDKGHRLYRRRSLPAREPRLPVFPVASRSISAREDQEHQEQPPRAAGFGSVHAKMVEQYAPPSILVSENHDIVHYSARAGQYLQQPGGEPTSNVFRLVREPLQLELRTVLLAARDRGQITQSKPVTLSMEGRERRIVMRIHPAADPELQGFVLVIFDELEPQRDGADPGEAGDGSITNRELETELQLNRQRLQAVIEEYEVGQEEMQAANEELQSANEELRSTLEELETSKEELQSMNEELATVNQENRHRVEELSQLTADLQNLLAATDIATLFLDRELRIVRFAPQVGELFNIRTSDRGRPLSDLTHCLGDHQLQDDARQVLDRLTPVEREIRSEHGRWYLTRVLPYRTTDNRIDGVVITLIDISARIKAEQALRNSQERLRRALDIESVGVLFFDGGGSLIDANRAFLEMTGYSRADLHSRGITWQTLTPPEWVEASQHERAKLQQTGRIGPYEKEYFRKDGSRSWMLFVGQSLEDGTLVEFCFDINDRKRAEASLHAAKEEAERAGQVKDKFMAVLSHELRTPLSPVLLAVSSLEQEAELSPLARDSLDTIRRNVEIEARLIDDLLDLSRVLNGKLRMQLQPASLHGIIRHAMHICAEAADARKIRLTDRLISATDTVLGDSARLQQVLWNLLSNAIKFSPEGTEVLIESATVDGAAIQITVSDHGIGIPSEALDRIFLPFEQVQSDAAQRLGGLGLGLAICRGIVDAHGGSLSAHSGEPGGGSRFVLKLPLIQGPPPAPARDAAAGRIAASETSGRRILVVDDHEDTARVLARLLKAQGFCVEIAHTVKAALDIVEARPIDLLISDIGLPDASGHQLMRQISKRHSIKGISLSGYGRDEDFQRSREAGFSHHLVKPIDLAKLAASIRDM